ncbi:MAG: hypothetical protein R6V40_00935 [Candidatus Moraniibacteriota bacterium]
MFREINEETAGLLRKTLELSGVKNLSLFPMKKGGGYLLSRNGEDFFVYLENKEIILRAPSFQKDCRDALCYLIKKKPEYFFFMGDHFWSWRAGRFVKTSQDENLARIFRLAGLRKKFSLKVGRVPNFFSGNIGKNFFIGQWFILSGLFILALKERDLSFLQAVNRIMKTQPLANYRQSLSVNDWEISEFFLWDNINPECTEEKLRKQEVRGEIFNLNFSPEV